MAYLLCLAAFITIMGFLPERIGLQRNNHKMYIIICGTVVALMGGLRTIYTGSTDTYTYSTLQFLRVRLYDNFWDYYDIYLGENGFLFSESGFYGFLWLLGRLTDNGQWLVFSSTTFFVFSVCRFIYKNSVDVPLSLLMYVCLGMFTFSMDGMRQAYAMCICLYAYEFAKNRKLIPFLLTVLIALMFHKTAIFFIPMYFIPILKNSVGNIVIFIACVLVITLSFDKLVPWFNEATGKEYTTEGAGAEGGGLSVILIYALSMVLTFLVKPLEIKHIRISFFSVAVAFCLYISRYFVATIVERASYYYYYFTILLIPAIIKELSEEERKVVKVLFIVATIALYAYRLYVGNYRTFKLFFRL